MSWPTGLLTLRNVAILAGVLGLAFATQSLRIKYKSNKIENLEAEISIKTLELKNTRAANKSNILAIKAQEKELQQCVYKREKNQAQAVVELQTNQKRIADLNNEYEKIRNEMPKMGDCITPNITDDVIGSVLQARRNQD